MFQNADGVPENKIEALRWFELAAKQGDADAQYNLAWMLQDADGVPENKVEALKWFELAAKQETQMHNIVWVDL